MQSVSNQTRGLQLSRRNAQWQGFSSGAILFLTWLLLCSAAHGAPRNSFAGFGVQRLPEWESGAPVEAVAGAAAILPGVKSPHTPPNFVPHSPGVFSGPPSRHPVQGTGAEGLRLFEENSPADPPLRAEVQTYFLEAALSQGFLRPSANPRLKAVAVGNPVEVFEKQFRRPSSLRPSFQRLRRQSPPRPFSSVSFSNTPATTTWVQIEDLLVDKRRLRLELPQGGEAVAQLRVASASGSQVQVSVRLTTDWNVTATALRRALSRTKTSAQAEPPSSSEHSSTPQPPSSSRETFTPNSATTPTPTTTTQNTTPTTTTQNSPPTTTTQNTTPSQLTSAALATMTWLLPKTQISARQSVSRRRRDKPSSSVFQAKPEGALDFPLSKTTASRQRRAPPLGTLLLRLASRREDEEAAAAVASKSDAAADVSQAETAHHPSQRHRRLQAKPSAASAESRACGLEAFFRRSVEEALSPEGLAMAAAASASVQRKLDAVLTAELGASVGTEAFVQGLQNTAASLVSATEFRLARELPAASASPEGLPAASGAASSSSSSFENDEAESSTAPDFAEAKAQTPQVRVLVFDEKAFASLGDVYPLRVLVGWRCSALEIRRLRRRAQNVSASEHKAFSPGLDSRSERKPREPLRPATAAPVRGASLFPFSPQEWLDPSLFRGFPLRRSVPPPLQFLALALSRKQKPETDAPRREKQETAAQSPALGEEKRRLSLLRRVEDSLSESHVKVASVEQLYRQPGLAERQSPRGAAEKFGVSLFTEEEEGPSEDLPLDGGAQRRAQRLATRASKEKGNFKQEPESASSSEKPSSAFPATKSSSLLTSPELCGVDLIRLAVPNDLAAAETARQRSPGERFRPLERFIRGLAKLAVEGELLFVTPDARIKIEQLPNAPPPSKTPAAGETETERQTERQRNAASPREEGGSVLCGEAFVPNDPLLSLQWYLGRLSASDEICSATDEGRDFLFGAPWRGSPSQLSSQLSKLAILCSSPPCTPFSRKDIRIAEASNLLRLLEAPNSSDAKSPRKKRSVPVAVIDTGLDFLHPDLEGGLWLNRAEVEGLPGVDDDNNGFVDDAIGWNFLHKNNNPTDDHGHGTHVAGIIAARCDNGVGICGISDEARIMALKILDRNGEGDVSNAIPAIRYAVSNGAAVVTNSWGGVRGGAAYVLGMLLEQAVSDASSTVFVIASGNDGNDISASAYYPASFLKDWTATVGAHDRLGASPAWANFGGESLLLTAPGELVVSTWTGGGYRLSSGTSMAAPMASAVAAKVLSLSEGLALPQQVVDVLARSAEREALHNDTRRAVSLTGGRLDAEKALTLAALLFAFPQQALLHLGTDSFPETEGSAAQTVRVVLKAKHLPPGEYRATLHLVYGRLATVAEKNAPLLQRRVLQLVKVLVPVEMAVV